MVSNITGGTDLNAQEKCLADLNSDDRIDVLDIILTVLMILDQLSSHDFFKTIHIFCTFNSKW